MLIIHASDIHLGYRQYGLKEREEDFYESFRVLLKNAVKMNADAIIIAGDLLHHKDIRAEQWLVIKELLTDNKIPLYVISGNHDKAALGGKSWLEALADAGYIDLIDNDVRMLECNGEQVCIIGLPWKGKLGIEDLPAPLGRNNILVCHAGVIGELENAADIGEVNADVLAEMNNKYDYIAAGHYHYVYNQGKFHNAGSLETTGMNDAGKVHGYFVIDTTTFKVHMHEYHGRPFHRIAISIKDIPTLPEMGGVIDVNVIDTAEELRATSVNDIAAAVKARTGAMYVNVKLTPTGFTTTPTGANSLDIGNVLDEVFIEIAGKEEATHLRTLIDDLDNGRDGTEAIDNWFNEWRSNHD